MTTTMPETMRILLIECRRGLQPRLAPLIGLIHIALMWTDLGWWQGAWPAASAAIGAPVLFLGPMTGALSAWEVLRRRQTMQPFTPRQAALLMAAHGLGAALIIAMGTIFAVVVNLLGHAPASTPWWSYLVIALALAVECVGAGFLIAALGGPPWFAPTITVMAMLLRIVSTQGAAIGSPESAWTRVFLSGPPYVELNGAAVVAAVLECVLVCGAALGLPAVLTRWLSRRRGAVHPLSRADRVRRAAATAALVAAASAVLASPPTTRDRPAVDPVCTSGAVRLCVWPEQEARLASLESIGGRAEQLMARWGVPGGLTLSEFGLDPARDGNFILGGQEHWFLANDLASAITNRLVNTDCLPEDDTDPEQAASVFLAISEVRALLALDLLDGARPADAGESTGVDWDRVAQVARTGHDQQRAWVDERIETIKAFERGGCA